MTAEYTPNELLVARLAKEMRDGEMGFVGVGSSGRAFSLAVGIPLAASRLAQLTHAPDFHIQLGPVIDPVLTPLPPVWNDSTAYDRPAQGFIDATDNIAALQRGGVDISFISGAQIDQFGNLNVTEIRGSDGVAKPLIGALALPEHQAMAQRSIIMADLSPRVFVEKVDFISGVGYLDGGRSREEAGLRPVGPALVLTDMAIFDFAPDSRRMRLVALHPGFSVDDVLAQMSFRPEIADEVRTTEEPTAADLALIRTEIDPDRLLIGSEPRHWHAEQTTHV